MDQPSTRNKLWTKQQLLLLIASALFFLVAIGLDVYLKQSVNLDMYTKKVITHLHQQEEKVDAIFADKSFLKRLTQHPTEDEYSSNEADIERFEAISAEDFTILIYDKDSLILWSNNMVAPLQKTWPTSPSKATRLVQLPNGYYEQLQYPYLEKGNGTRLFVALIPIKYQYQLESDYLRNIFTADQSIPAEIAINNKVSSFPIINSHDQHIGFLHAPNEIIDINWLNSLMWLYLIAFAILGVFINSIAKKLTFPKQPWIGAAFLITCVFGLRLISIVLGFTDRFSVLPLFAKNFDTPLSNSLGDLLINIILLLWVMIFFHKEARLRSFEHLSRPVKFGLTTLNYFSILIGILIITTVFRALVFNTGITFDFDNVFNLDRYSLIAIIGVILLLTALFLFGHRMMLAIVEIGLSRYYRLLSLGIATIAVAPLLVASQLMLPTAYLLLIAFVFILIFDLFIDSNTINFTWLVIWLVILSAFPSILLFKYNAYRDRIVRISYAKQLADFRDTIAEHSFEKLSFSIKQDEKVANSLSRPFPFKLDQATVNDQINKYFTQDNYLFNNYEFKVFAFNKYGDSAIKDQDQQLTEFTDQINRTQLINQANLSLTPQDGKSVYLMDLEVQPVSDPTNPIQLFIQYHRHRRDQSKVYTELLVNQPYKHLTELEKYDYAIYNKEQLVDSEGGVYGQTLDLNMLPQVLQNKEIINGKRSELICRVSEDKTVIIGKEKELFIKAISLFSYIFGMLVLLMLVFAVVNTIVRILPDAFSFALTRKPSLRNRIQLSVIMLIISSFFIIGMVTVWFFNTSSEDYHEKRLERKTLSVLRNAIHDVESHSLKDSTFNISEIVIPLTRIHRIDINMYNESGNLIGSSEEDIYNRGIITHKMHPLAYHALHHMGASEYVHERERVGELIYKSAYVPLNIQTANGQKTMAYLGLPYYSKRSNQRNDVTIFMSTLLNVYVFLLLIAGAIAIAVANSITRPLSKIGDKLKQVKLGKGNEQLEWKSQDELGELIEEYNRMIKKLEDSADRLAQSEREGAWREMAKQVAHEIKNPLTPMKLSIQYLQHAYKSNPDDIEPLLQRVAGTLIEQIDNLAQIASEFSNFAKMPRAENQKIILNQLVQSVFDLFSNEQYEMDLSLDISLPNEEFFVYADRNHLMRVLNNLIKNAIQAIPDERSGIVNVFLYKRDNQAIIKVNDNGTGIPDDKRDKVFVPNFTTKNSGTGLGLAISKNIIESVNGEIFFETRVNEGTDFYVILPLVEVNQLVDT